MAGLPPIWLNPRTEKEVIALSHYIFSFTLTLFSFSPSLPPSFLPSLPLLLVYGVWDEVCKSGCVLCLQSNIDDVQRLCLGLSLSVSLLHTYQLLCYCSTIPIPSSIFVIFHPTC